MHDPIAPIESVSKLPDSFWQNVDFNGPPARYAPGVGWCWLWTGPRDGHGYGNSYAHIGEDGRKGAHAIAYKDAFGEIPEGMEVDHWACGLTSCVNPAHLRAVTHQWNSQNRRDVRSESGFRGVVKTSTGGNWEAYGRLNGRRISIGTYTTPEAAGRAASHWRRHHYPGSIGDMYWALEAGPYQRLEEGLTRHARTKFTGVTRNPSGTWKARVTRQGAHYNLGAFGTREEARVAVATFLEEYNHKECID